MELDPNACVFAICSSTSWTLLYLVEISLHLFVLGLFRHLQLLLLLDVVLFEVDLDGPVEDAQSEDVEVDDGVGHQLEAAIVEVSGENSEDDAKDKEKVDDLARGEHNSLRFHFFAPVADVHTAEGEASRILGVVHHQEKQRDDHRTKEDIH